MQWILPPIIGRLNFECYVCEFTFERTFVQVSRYFVQYINVDRYWQNAIVGTDEPQSDGGSGDFFTWMTNFGDDFKER